LVVQRLGLSGLVARRPEEAFGLLGECLRLLYVSGHQLGRAQVEGDRRGIGVVGSCGRLTYPFEEVGEDLHRLRDSALREVLEAYVGGDADVGWDAAVLAEPDRREAGEVIGRLHARHGHGRARRQDDRLDRLGELQARVRQRYLDLRPHREHQGVVQDVAGDAVVRLERRVDQRLSAFVRTNRVLVLAMAVVRLSLA
jgi:hypothetical protein